MFLHKNVGAAVCLILVFVKSFSLFTPTMHAFWLHPPTYKYNCVCMSYTNTCITHPSTDHSIKVTAMSSIHTYAYTCTAATKYQSSLFLERDRNRDKATKSSLLYCLKVSLPPPPSLSLHLSLGLCFLFSFI